MVQHHEKGQNEVASDMIRTCAPEGIRPAGERINHSTTLDLSNMVTAELKI